MNEVDLTVRGSDGLSAVTVTAIDSEGTTVEQIQAAIEDHPELSVEEL
jgi:hypothetical protein